MSKNGAPTLDDLVPVLSREIKEKQEQVTKLEVELGEARSEYQRWRGVLSKLDVTALPPEVEKTPQQRKRQGRPRTEPRISEERYARFRDTILEYAKNHEEFRAVDIRVIAQIDSSALTEGLERMRQEGIIRLARREGNSKWFRLTPAAVRSMA